MYKAESAPNISKVSPKYHEFTDVFSKSKAKVLTFHFPYDLKINLEEDVQFPVGTIYSLSAFKQEALKEFIEKNLNIEFIQPTSFL